MKLVGTITRIFSCFGKNDVYFLPEDKSVLREIDGPFRVGAQGGEIHAVLSNGIDIPAVDSKVVVDFNEKTGEAVSVTAAVVETKGAAKAEEPKKKR